MTSLPLSGQMVSLFLDESDSDQSTGWVKPTTVLHPLFHSTWISIILILSVSLRLFLHILPVNNKPNLAPLLKNDLSLTVTCIFRTADYHFPLRQWGLKFFLLLLFSGSSQKLSWDWLCVPAPYVTARPFIRVPQNSISSVLSLFLFHRNTDLSFKVIFRLI
jgi:hypothetical protein